MGSSLWDEAFPQSAQQTQRAPLPNDPATTPARTDSLVTEAFEPTNKQRSGDFWTRLQRGMKITDAGKLNYLMERYGKENVFVRPNDGHVIIRDAETGETFDFDPSPTGAGSFVKDLPGDVADVAGDIAEGAAGALPATYGAAKGAAAGTLLGGPLGGVLGGVVGAMAGGAIGGGAAQAARQATSETLPGSEELTRTQRAQLIGDAATMGGTTEGVLRGGGALFDAVRPANMMRRGIAGNAVRPAVPPGVRSVIEESAATKLNREALDEFMGGVAKQEGTAAHAAQGRRLAKTTGVDLSVGQVSGSRTALKLEGMLAQRPGSEGVMWEAVVKRAQQLESYIGKQLDKLGRVGAEAAGEEASAAFESYVSQAASNRSRVFRKLFEKAEKASGGQRVMPLANTLREIDRLAADFTPEFYMESADKVVKTLQRIKGELLSRATEGLQAAGVKQPTQAQVEEAVTTTVKSFQRTLSNVGDVAVGKGTIIENLGDQAVQQHVAKRIKKAMMTDLDDAAASEVAGDAAAYLKTARDAYRTLSEPIDTASKSILSKALKLTGEGAPDKIAQRLVSRGWSDVQVRDAMKLLQKTNPESARHIRAAALEEVLSKAKPGSALENRGVGISPAAFAGVASNQSSRIQALFAGDTRGLVQFKKAAMVARRIGDTAGVGPGQSQTAPLLFYKELADAVLQGKINPQAAIGQVFGLMSAKKMAITMTSPEGREAFLQMVQTGEGKKVLASAIRRVGYVISRDEKLLTETEDRQAPKNEAE